MRIVCTVPVHMTPAVFPAGHDPSAITVFGHLDRLGSAWKEQRKIQFNNSNVFLNVSIMRLGSYR